jgi:hypothetical protein
MIRTCFAFCLFAGFGSLFGHSEDVGKTVTIEAGKDHFDFLTGDALAARFQFDTASANLAKPYFWPVLGPGGVPMTRAWPMKDATPGGTRDHPNHKSVWFGHGNVIPGDGSLSGGEGIDFWSEGSSCGRIVCTRASCLQNRIEAHCEWRTAQGQKILSDVRRIQLFDLGSAQLFVFDIQLLADVGPITFGDTKEGSFAVRVNDAIREYAGGKIANAEGKVGEFNCWGRQSAWCDYSGPIQGKIVGLAIFDHPENKYRAGWHCRGYGLLAANPFGRSRTGFPATRGRRDLVHLAHGDQLNLRYGLLLHSGNAKDGKVAKYYDRFIKLKR